MHQELIIKIREAMTGAMAALEEVVMQGKVSDHADYQNKIGAYAALHEMSETIDNIYDVCLERLTTFKEEE